MAAVRTASVGEGVGKEALPVRAKTMACAYVIRVAMVLGNLRMASGR
jgi:hypothetical protein